MSTSVASTASALASVGFFFNLNSVLLHVPLLQEAGFQAEWRYLQVLDLENSNPYCVVCAPPIAGHVVCLYHDGAGLQLEFPNVWGLIEAVHAQVASGTDLDVTVG